MKHNQLCLMTIVSSFVVCGIFFGGCKDQGTVPLSEYVEINYLSGTIGEFSEPPVPPDPISCQLKLQIHNRSELVAFRTFRWQEAKVYRVSDGIMLGTFAVTTSWHGHLPPLSTDTLVLTKLSGNARPFSPPCEEVVYVELSWVSNENVAGKFKTPNMVFGCAH